MEINTEERMFIENITFTDFEDLKSIDFAKTLSFIKDCLSQNEASQHNSSIRSQRTGASIHNSQTITNSQNKTLRNSRVSNESFCNKSVNNSVLSTQQTDLRNWGLPQEIVAKYHTKGIKNMFKWQVECLGNSKIIHDNGNLVYSAPTSAGKTLVAEIITIKTVLERQKKVIIILPFVSVVREKMFYFQDIFSDSGIRVEGYMGSHSPAGGFQSVHIAVCTIEKANSLVNSMLENGSIYDLGAIVVDELHLLGDPHRGYILELLLTKILYVSRRYEEVNIQIVGMSATLPNLSLLSQWLGAELYKTQFRPIPLNEMYYVDGCIYNSDNQLQRTLEKSDLPNDRDFIISLTLETIFQGCSVLIFCSSKQWCENLAQQMSASFRSVGYSNSPYSVQLREQLDGSTLNEVLEQLKASPVGLDTILHQTISFGVAFHHAGLTMDERDIIEGAFKRNIIRVLIATSTLSSGVNLPARRVIVRSPTFCSKPINILTYKQMIGRAGRTGMDSAGESILMCTTNERNIGECLISGTLEPVASCLEGGDKLMRAILEAIASQVAKTPNDVDLFINCTLLLNSLSNEDSMKTYAEETVKELVDYELIRLQTTDDETFYIATALGKACLSSSMAPQDGLILFKELQKARECFVLETDLHMIYLVTPYSICSQWGNINWMHFLDLWDKLSKAMKRVGELVGVKESLIYSCVRGCVKQDSQAFQNKLRVLKRFYTSLALQDLINEVPLSVVASNFNCSRGMLQSLQQSAATFAGMVTAFSRQLGWKSFETLVSQFQDRLQFGVQSDLLDLMRLQSLNGVRARAIFNTGIETINQLAVADSCIIENALHSALPFQSEKERDGEVKYDVEQRNNMKNIWITGKKGVTAREAAQLLIQEARIYLQYELGVTEVRWKTRTGVTNDDETDVTSTQRSNETIENGGENNASSSTNLTSSIREIDEEPIRSSLISNQSPNSNTVDSPVLLSESDKKFNIEDMTMQNTTDKDNKLLQDSLPEGCDSLNEAAMVESCCKSPNITESQDIKLELELSPTDFMITNLTGIDVSSKLAGTSANDNAFDDANISLKSNCSVFQSDASKELSMFEDSLEIDTQLCKLLDKSKNRNSNESVQRNSIGKDDIPMSISKIFAAPFEESLKPVSSKDESKRSIDEFCKPFDDITSKMEPKRSIDDVIMSSQEFDNTNVTKVTKVVTPKRKMNSENGRVKRRRFLNSENIFGDLEKSDIVSSSPVDAKVSILKSRNIRTTQRELRKRVENLKDIISKTLYRKIKVPHIKHENISSKIMNTHLYALDVSSHIDLFDKCCSHIMGSNTLSVFLDYETEKPQPKIGCNIIKNKHNNSAESSKLPSNLYQGKYLRSVSLFVEKNFVYHFHLSNDVFDRFVAFLKSVFGIRTKTVIMYDFKISYLALRKCIGVDVRSVWEDPIVGDWLLDPESSSKTLYKMCEAYCMTDIKPLLRDKQVFEIMCMNAWITYHTMQSVKHAIRMKHERLLDTFGVEMKALRVVSLCELHGMEVDKTKAGQVLAEVKQTQAGLERLAYKMAGQRFKITCSSDVAKVLGMYKGQKVSTNKKKLERMDNPLAQVVIHWRKLNAILTKNLFPLTAKAVENSNEKRIFGSYWMQTSTGRMSMQEPNLQSIPRNFEIPLELFSMLDNDSNVTVRHFSCRDIFPSAPGATLVSADYCQLELRILSHLCEDDTLRRIVRSGEDIFRAIAASWKGIDQQEVDEDLRQKAKQMCYGIIYGMGRRTLAQSLDVCELEAGVFVESFHSAYPGIRGYVAGVVGACGRTQCVETLSGRRRYLPGINSGSLAEKAHAERQAVNTTIQGSAADIVKSAMISIHQELEAREDVFGNVKLVLLLHDELIYEVPDNVVDHFEKVLRDCMENTVTLSVPLPVKIKVGKSWGNMKEISTLKR